MLFHKRDLRDIWYNVTDITYNNYPVAQQPIKYHDFRTDWSTYPHLSAENGEWSSNQSGVHVRFWVSRLEFQLQISS